MRCARCGMELENGNQFCTNCGAPCSQGSITDDHGQATSRSPMPLPQEQPPYEGHKARQTTKWKTFTAVMAIIILLLTLASTSALTNGFGLLRPSQDNAASSSDVQSQKRGDGRVSNNHDSDGPDNDIPVVRDSVDAYSWNELSEISNLIMQADTDDEGLAIAKRYHLCSANDTLDGSQAKTVKLKDGTTTSAQIVGFRHDTRSDGKGQAGITFIFVDALDTHTMQISDTNNGGWRNSDLRGWVNSEVLARLPDDLQHEIVAVDKYTNNTGCTYDADAVTITSDKLWIPSYNEIIGDVDASLSDNLYVFNAEGDKYQLYVDTDVLWSATNPILVKHLAGQSDPISWWQRSPYPDNDEYFMDTGGDGIPYYAHIPTKNFGVVPGFCI